MTGLEDATFPFHIGSMLWYILAYITLKNQPNCSYKYTIHGSYMGFVKMLPFYSVTFW